MAFRQNWQVLPGGGMGMLFPHMQNWRTSPLPFSLATRNTVNTGVSYDTPSGAIANQKWWATRGFQGFGARVQYPGRGMDGCCGGCSSGLGQFFTADAATSFDPFDTSTWGVGTYIVVGLVGLYAAYSMFSTTKRGAQKTYLGLEAKAQRRRKSRAARYREKAKALEAKGLGGIFA